MTRSEHDREDRQEKRMNSIPHEASSPNGTTSGSKTKASAERAQDACHATKVAIQLPRSATAPSTSWTQLGEVTRAAVNAYDEQELSSGHAEEVGVVAR